MIDEKVVKLHFEPVEHKYTDEEGTEYTSCTTVIEDYKEDFDAEYWSVYRTLERAKYKVIPSDLPGRKITIIFNSSKYQLSINQIKIAIREKRIKVGKSYNTVLTEWKKEAEEACKVGSDKHDYIEECINAFYGERKHDVNSVADFTKDIPQSPFKFRLAIRTLTDLENSPLKDSDPKVYDILKRAINSGYTLYAEVRVYSYFYKTSGTIDVFAVKGKDFVIIDWKTNKDELKFYSGYYVKVWNKDRTKKIKTDKFKATNKTFKAPLTNIPLCKGETYTLQLSLYAYMCERWGFNCKGLILCHLLGVRNEDKDTKIYANIKYRKNDVIRMLEHHKMKKENKFVRAI